MPLTAEQCVVFRDLLDAIEQSALKIRAAGVRLLVAPAGTGKTHIIKAVHEATAAQAVIQILAPTNKAASLFTGDGLTCATIHSYFRARRTTNKAGEVMFKLHDPAARTPIIIVDECSMIDTEMYNALLRVSARSLVLFCGDTHQLPPVGEEESPVFAAHDPDYRLTRNMRSPDSPHNALLEDLRRAVDEGLSGRALCELVPERTHIDDMLDVFGRRPRVDVVALAWTNSRVAEINAAVRAHLFGAGARAKYQVGERLVFSGYRQVGGTTYRSSDIIEVITMGTRAIWAPYWLCEHQDTDGGCVRYCRKCSVAGRPQLGHNLEFIVITDQYDNEWYIVRERSAARLDEILGDFKQHCARMKDESLWVKYHEMNDEYRPQLSYSYAMTVHKAQGSQWAHVFVDVDNILGCRDGAARLLYTAASRMRDEVYFLARTSVNMAGAAPPAYRK